jgi:hypothetical protein
MGPANCLIFEKGYKKFPKATGKMCGRTVMYGKRHVISTTQRKSSDVIAKEQPHFRRHKALSSRTVFV